MDERPKAAREAAWYLALGQVGLEMVAPIILGLWLDYEYGLRPWCTIGGVVLGFVGGLGHLILMTNRRQNQTKANGGPA